MLDALKNSLSLYLLIPCVALIGLTMTIRFKFVQCTNIIKAWKYFIQDRDPSGRRSSSFSALSAVLGGNLGTGNISGIAVALTIGGPGALFWMWVMALLGTVLKFINCTLGVLYREKNDQGEYVGGPMYYLAKGLKLKSAAIFYCILAIFAALTVGNLVQMNSLALPFTKAGVHPLITGIGMALIIASVILGGLHRFSKVASFVVPFMAVGYVAACLVILIANVEGIWPALQLIYQCAFDPTAVAGGLAGYTLLAAIKVGFDRGLFATDVGVGIDAIVHASVESKTPLAQTALTQGLISTLSPLIVMIVCSLTGLVLMVTQAWQVPGLESTNICIEAFQRGLGIPFAGHIITVTLFFFAFTTILTWSFCADKAVEYLFSRRFIKPFQYLFVAFIPMGALFHVTLVWTIADIFMNLMLILNMIGIVGLYREVASLYEGPVREHALTDLTPSQAD